MAVNQAATNNANPTFSTTFFNTKATTYGSHVTALHGPLIEHILDKYCLPPSPPQPQSSAPHPILPTSTILDNACGAGVVTEVLFSHLPASSHPAELYMTDISPGMIGAARKLIDTLPSHTTKITALVHDSQRLTYDPRTNADAASPATGATPLLPDTFTQVFTNMALYLFPSPLTALRQIYLLLSPGGISFTTAYVSMGNMAWHHAAQRSVRPDEEPFAGPAPRYWGNEGNLRKALVEAGFEAGKVWVDEVRWEVDRRTCPGPMRMQVAEMMMKGWSEEEKGKFREEFERVLEEKRREEEGVEGEMKVEMVALVGVGVK